MLPAYDTRHEWHRRRSQAVSSFDRLTAYLAARAEPRLKLTFGEVEAILGELLPWGARLGSQWWGDHRTGRRQHSRAWRAAGWRVAGVDAHAGRVTFVRGPPG